MLVLFSVKASGGNVNNAFNAAAAVELLHNFTLVHDDIMDEADKRRGRPTLHKLHDLVLLFFQVTVFLLLLMKLLSKIVM